MRQNRSTSSAPETAALIPMIATSRLSTCDALAAAAMPPTSADVSPDADSQPASVRIVV
ncbi:hypothetical protein BamIOP4010DRAFT_6789 [Burkholderia ambifaria IOP40-10]|uniref:Uncharacterized protein n=1 Tax=Burkholderia ambifaria IOP40-10 TaxID=396596 RepID=B1FRX2_9BURK|nr:hypothetical protein BamIOP4010DRAFT_6789 [Burkholderia ambifaria IOP40-10]